jgi:hypothetical protein
VKKVVFLDIYVSIWDFLSEFETKSEMRNLRPKHECVNISFPAKIE